MSTIFWSSLTESIHQLFEGKIETETKKIITATLKQEFFNAACATGNLERVNTYLAEGLDLCVNIISVAIGYASSNGRIEIVDRLLFHESQINLNGALYYASCYGHIAIVDLLLKSVAGSRITRINLLRTFCTAKNRGYTQIEELIKSYIT